MKRAIQQAKNYWGNSGKGFWNGWEVGRRTDRNRFVLDILLLMRISLNLFVVLFPRLRCGMSGLVDWKDIILIGHFSKRSEILERSLRCSV